MADVDAGVPLLSGDDFLMRVFMNNDKFGEDLIVSASVKANTTKYRDPHGGNKVLKVDVRVWGWDVDIKFHYKTDRMLKAALAVYNSKMVPGSAPIVVGIMLASQQRDAAANLPGYLLSPVVFDYDLAMSGQTERLTQGLSCWAETLKPYVAT